VHQRFDRHAREVIPSRDFKVASNVLDAFLKSREEPIPDLLKAIRKIAEERQMSKKFTDQVVSGYLAEPEQSRFGVINDCQFSLFSNQTPAKSMTTERAWTR